jgi:hypothetical protein
MGTVTFILMLLAVYLAFRAGSRWRHHTRTWSDHKVAAATEKRLRKLRWVTFTAAVGAALIVFIYLTVTGTTLDALYRKAIPAKKATPASSATPSAKPSPSGTTPQRDPPKRQ